MKNILIALDYHPTAQKIAEDGLALAKAFNGKVILAHIINNSTFYAASGYDPIMGFNGYMNMDILDNDNDRMTELEKTSYEFLFNTKEHLGDITIEAVVIQGNVAESILELAKQKEIDIIILGTHSQRWLDHLLIGSNAEKILNKTTIPLYIIPTSKKE
jgi:nucleotide-binding universal stress UspA family protein